MKLTDRKSHFEFGKNWRDYAKSVDRTMIDFNTAALRKLLPEGLTGKSFVDIGSGSGIRSLAAFELGAASVRAIDIDENSVSTTHDLLMRFAQGKAWTVETVSVFDIRGSYDVVFSWGVLHHTGDMWRAIQHAATLVKPGGLFAIAIYTKGPHYEHWQAIKRFYSGAPAPLKAVLRTAYMSAFLGYMGLVVRENPFAFVRNYPRGHGMSYSHDAHDWLGGFPYEAASVEEVKAKLASIGLTEVRTFAADPGRGIWGAPCSEYVYRRATGS